MCTIVSMRSTQKSKERFCRTCCVKSCGSMLLDCTCPIVKNFPGLGTRQTDTQKLTFGSPGTQIPIQSLAKKMKWYENFMHKQRHGKVSHCALLIYNISIIIDICCIDGFRMFYINQATTKKSSSQLFWKMHIFSAKKQPTNLNPKA